MFSAMSCFCSPPSVPLRASLKWSVACRLLGSEYQTILFHRPDQTIGKRERRSALFQISLPLCVYPYDGCHIEISNPSIPSDIAKIVVEFLSALEVALLMQLSSNIKVKEILIKINSK